jgi:DNA-binding protein YbaB
MIFSGNDKIKGEESACYAQEAIEIHETLLTIYKRNPIDELKSTFENIPTSIIAMQVCPQSTYSLLQEGSKTWHEIKEIFYGPSWGSIKEQHKKLHDLYLLASNNAYKKISTSYSSKAQELFGQLWAVSSTILKQDNAFSKDLAAAQLLLIAKFFATIEESSSNTYSALEDMEKMSWFINGAEQIKNKEHRHQRGAILRELKNCYDEIKAPGIFD